MYEKLFAVYNNIMQDPQDKVEIFTKMHVIDDVSSQVFPISGQAVSLLFVFFPNSR